ncbi:uncharacterized protein F5Z01DRAFT_189878 [Emericellopsis atlantica]|uniref:Uncharacterized protein n=1 Tax=Emericellopsis atlantica TaxID=2614577 RepID=A0A9P8CPM0_9HYPO|nr:uncharacterized protein F5Z01DRAFT_189878 [Emericellopsis atlantica]KAG9252886.1 hypothetical protein F5Z01DRAFT_189878 [Emericellopsis atlantica]
MSQFVKDEELCQQYAQFASHMVGWQFKIIYWTMFMSNLFVLFLASWTFTKGQEAAERLSDDLKKRAKRLRFYIFLCLGCVAVSAVIVVMEAYALLALQFCDGEDLMSLYWSTWTMIQVGSLIAMVGIILAMCHSLKQSRHPPWALALGTPVLVIAGFLHLFHACGRKGVKKMKASFAARGDDDGNPMGAPMSQANTIQAPEGTEDETIEGEFIGFTIDGGPIVRFTNRFINCQFPSNMELLGHCNDDRPIVAYRKDSIRFISDSNKKAVCPDRRNDEQEEKVHESV